MLAFTNMEAAGLLPQFVSEHDPRPAKEQINEAYAHGGGWNSFEGFTLVSSDDKSQYGLDYPGDPMSKELSRAMFRDELLVFFKGSWLAIIQKDGSFEVSRLD